MNKIAIENGLAYVVEYISANEVEITGPVNSDTNESADCRIVAYPEKNSIKLMINGGEIKNLAANQKDDITVVFKDLIDNMIQDFCMQTKFVYIKNGENYTMIGDM
jgi:hypothetical protein